MQGDKIKTYKLVRNKDINGLSGTGDVAIIAAFPSGRAVMEWTASNHATLTIFNGGIEEIAQIHGHNGNSVIVSLDEPKKHNQKRFRRRSRGKNK